MERAGWALLEASGAAPSLCQLGLLPQNFWWVRANA